MVKPKPHKYRKRNIIRDSLMIPAGVLSAAYGLKGFLLPNEFIDGGVTGISLLINQVTGLSLSMLIFFINIPFVALGYIQQSKSFGIKTFIAISALALAVHFLDFPVATSDKLLVSVFGGFFLGAGIGLAMRGGCVIDGTEVLAIFATRKTGLTIGDFILLVNIVIFTFAAFLLSYEIALYSILAYLSASKTIDYVVQGIEEYTGVTIVSEKSDQIRHAIIHEMGRGVTIYQGKRGYGKKGDKNMDIDVVFTVITRLEIAKLKSEVEKIDDQAFVVTHSINETKGGMIKKRALH
jgi:uncharacterized membrane-anchored protein YitT (DUF2179 family)